MNNKKKNINLVSVHLLTINWIYEKLNMLSLLQKQRNMMQIYRMMMDLLFSVP